MEMSLAALMLIVYVLWAVALGLLVVTWQGVRNLKSMSKTESVPTRAPRDGKDGYTRALHAQSNAMEYLPAFASIVLLELQYPAASEIFGLLAFLVVMGRIIQSALHLLSESPRTFAFRFFFFLVQMVATLMMVLDILRGVSIGL